MRTGRQVDGSISALEALPGCVAAVRAACEASGRPADAVPVFMDSGVRYGQHVLKAKALGATAVLYGRPVMMSLTLGGEEGVSHTLLNLLVSCTDSPMRAWRSRLEMRGPAHLTLGSPIARWQGDTECTLGAAGFSTWGEVGEGTVVRAAGSGEAPFSRL